MWRLPVKTRALSPRVRPGAPLGQEERGVTPSAPRISAATPEPHGNGIAGAGAWEQGCPRPGVLALPDLQRGARLCTAVWLSCAHTHTHVLPLYSFPFRFIPGDGTQFPVRHSRTLSFIHSK